VRLVSAKRPFPGTVLAAPSALADSLGNPALPRAVGFFFCDISPELEKPQTATLGFWAYSGLKLLVPEKGSNPHTLAGSGFAVR